MRFDSFGRKGLARRAWVVGGMVAVSVSLIAIALPAYGASSGGQARPSSPSSVNAGGSIRASSLTTVTVGLSPFFEYQPFVIAHDLGLDAAQGLNLQFVDLTASGGPIVSGLANGSLNIGSSCYSCDFPFVAAVPTIRDFLITNQYSGFDVIGRPGALTYNTLVKTESPAKAKAAVLHSFIGKTFDIQASVYESLLFGALKSAGINPKSVVIDDFSSDAASALAFEHGTGDFYMGGSPQEIKLMGYSPPKYVIVGGTEILGPAGLWYSTYVALQPWLSSNHTVALKLIAIWYRTMRYVLAYPAYSYNIWTKAMNKEAAANYTVAQVETFTRSLEAYPTYQEAEATIYNPKSPLYYELCAKYYATTKGSVLPSGYKLSTIVVDTQYFRQFLASSALVSWVNSTLVAPK